MDPNFNEEVPGSSALTDNPENNPVKSSKKLSILPIIILFIAASGLVIFKVIPQKPHLSQPFHNLFYHSNYPEPTPIKNTPANQYETDPNDTLQFEGFINYLHYDPMLGTTPENAVGATDRNLMTLTKNNVVSSDTIFNDFIIVPDTEVLINGAVSDKSALEEKNITSLGGQYLYPSASVEYYIYYTNLGGYEYIAKSINLIN